MVSLVTSSGAVCSSIPARCRIKGEEGGAKTKTRTRTTYGAHEERKGDGLLGARHGEDAGFDARDRDGIGVACRLDPQFVRFLVVGSDRYPRGVCKVYVNCFFFFVGARLLLCIWLNLEHFFFGGCAK